MRALKPLLWTIVVGIGYGVAHDIVYFDDAHTMPRVPAAVGLSGSGASVSSTASHTINWLSGDPILIPPRERHAPVVQEPNDERTFVGATELSRFRILPPRNT